MITNSVHTNENKMAQAACKTCEICMRAPGLHYCTQCDQVFCDDCNMSHLRSKISRSLKTAVDVTRLPSATYNRKNVNFSDVGKLFGNLTFQ